MNINIYTNYKIQYESTGCLIDEENSTSNYRVFSNFKHKDNFIEEGGALINRIAKYMLDNDCNEIKIENNHVVIMYFNPVSGESNIIKLEIEEEVNVNGI